MTEIKEIYSNNWTGELCIPNDLGIAPPERYLKTVKSVQGDVYVEHWACKDGRLLDIACPASRYFDEDIGIWHERDFYAKKNDVQLSYIRWWEIPPTLFNKYVNQFHLG